jgi:acetate kinase
LIVSARPESRFRGSVDGGPSGERAISVNDSLVTIRVVPTGEGHEIARQTSKPVQGTS